MKIKMEDSKDGKDGLYPSSDFENETSDTTDSNTGGDKYELSGYTKDNVSHKDNVDPKGTDQPEATGNLVRKSHNNSDFLFEDRDTGNKERRRNNRLQCGIGATSHKFSDALRFPGGHSKVNEDREKPSPLPLELRQESSNAATGNPGATSGVENSTENSRSSRDKDSFVSRETDDFVFFWREGSPFSQWYRAEFVIDGLNFNCAEQYMMYNKALMFKGDGFDLADLILKEPEPSMQKVYGRNVKGLDYDEWSKVAPDIVRKGNRAKFSQNEHLKEILLATYPKTLVEASPHDQIWGIGLHAYDPDALDKKKWKGQNLLGNILTEVRDEMLKEIGFI